MTDWRQAGQKADAHRVRDLYRRAFATDAKTIARSRVIEAMQAAGVTTVLDLWGGGVSAKQLVDAGFRVISVDDGSMELLDGDRKVSVARKKRALDWTAAEDGYEARFGKAERFAHEADGAYLDFCGPWSAGVRRTINACRHMKAVAVTLTPDHDIATGASSRLERELAYQLFLRMAWAEKPRREYMSRAGNVRRLLDYIRPRGYSVFVYLLSRSGIRLRVLTNEERNKTRPDMHQRRLAYKRKWYHSHDETWKREYQSRNRNRDEARFVSDPEYRERFRRYHRHLKHKNGSVPRLPCSFCEAA